MKNEELKKWVDKKVLEYRQNKVGCLEMMLYDTTQIIQQFLNSPTSKATRGVLRNCMNCNKRFISEIDKFAYDPKRTN